MVETDKGSEKLFKLLTSCKTYGRSGVFEVSLEAVLEMDDFQEYMGKPGTRY